MCGLILRSPQMAMNIKDLCGNSGHRFKNINNNNKKITLPQLLGFFLLAVSFLSGVKEIALIAADQQNNQMASKNKPST